MGTFCTLRSVTTIEFDCNFGFVGAGIDSHLLWLLRGRRSAEYKTSSATQAHRFLGCASGVSPGSVFPGRAKSRALRPVFRWAASIFIDVHQADLEDKTTLRQLCGNHCSEPQSDGLQDQKDLKGGRGPAFGLGPGGLLSTLRANAWISKGSQSVTC